MQYITVYHAGEEHARLVTQHFLRLPDGRKGIPWCGAVFPLLDGNRIEETGEAFPPSLCHPFLGQPGSARLVVLGPSGEAYLFLDGTSADRDRMSAELTARGVTVLRTGPNGSDHPGDWFLRLNNVDAERQAKIANLISRGSPVPDPAEAGLREALLAQALRSALQRQTELALRLHTLTADGAAERVNSAMLLHDIAALRAQFEALTESAVPASQPLTAPRASRLLKQELISVAVILLPRLRLLGGSLDFMATELTDRAPVWRALGELDRQVEGMPPAWKVVAGKHRWWERHFRTGHDNQGRLYARRDAGFWDVLVSHKQSQAHDIRNMS